MTGIVLGAAYMLWLYQRTMFGEITKEANKTLPDLDAREMATLIPIIAFCFWIGLYPAPFLRAMETSVANTIQIVEKGSAGKAVQARRAAVSGQPSALSQVDPTGVSPGTPVCRVAKSPQPLARPRGRAMTQMFNLADLWLLLPEIAITVTGLLVLTLDFLASGRDRDWLAVARVWRGWWS